MSDIFEGFFNDVISGDRNKIKMGLPRVREVAERLDLLSWSVPVVTVAGTNGKGSVLEVLCQCYTLCGYKNFLYTSPHLHSQNERFRVNGVSLDDESLMNAFQKVKTACEGTELTYFEYCTLVGLYVAKQNEVDVVLLEVGMGGRLDAVNIVDPTVCVITSIALDHMEYLGETREAIAIEKAGILRPGVPLVYGEADMPQTLLEKTRSLGVSYFQFGRDFSLVHDKEQWSYKSGQSTLEGQGGLKLLGQNVASALKVLELLAPHLPVNHSLVEQKITSIALSGRFQRERCNGREVIYDVAHNKAAVSCFCSKLPSTDGTTWAIFSALKGKDVEMMLKSAHQYVDKWLLVELDDPRAYSGLEMSAIFASIEGVHFTLSGQVESAVDRLEEEWGEGDRCLVFGSFVTVSAVQKQLGWL